MTTTATDLQTRVAALEAEVSSLRKQLDYAQAVAGIRRGQDDARQGQVTPLREVDRQMRTKYNIPPR